MRNKRHIKKIEDIKSNKVDSFSYKKSQSPQNTILIAQLIKLAIFSFLILLIINLINVYQIGKSLEKKISTNTLDGYNLLMEAGKSTTKIQFSDANKAFEEAIENFSQAQRSLWFYETDKTFYAQGTEISKALNDLLEGGQHFASAGEYFLEAVEYFNKLPIYFVNKNSTESSDTESVTDILNLGLEKTTLAINEINIASEKINNISDDLVPEEIQWKIKLAKEKIKDINELLNETATHFPALLKLLGDKHPHRYLILLQNNHEMRPTGGFIGSYAILDVNDGLIEKLETHDVYDLDGGFGERITPPEEFLKFTDIWRFRDSNYWPDFPLSADKAMWFLEKEGGPSVDTVIAINQGILADMLHITGPVQVGDFGTFTSENYELLLSFIIESKVWGSEDPKYILKLLVPAFKDAILKEENISRVSSKIYRAIQQKHIVMYSPDTEIQGLFDSINISGRMHEVKENEDYLSVVNISTGGTKSDKFIEEKIIHETHIQEDGKIIDEVTIIRTHQWTDDIYFKWQKILSNYGFNSMPDQIIDILGRGRNRTTIRVYTPPGSTLISSNKSNTETKYDPDLNKTYFLSEIEINAGQSDKINIKYELPYSFDLNTPTQTYRLIAEKQLGHPGPIFTKTFSTSTGIEILGTYPLDVRTDGTGRIIYPTDLVYDKYFSAIIKP